MRNWFCSHPRRIDDAKRDNVDDDDVVTVSLLSNSNAKNRSEDKIDRELPVLDIP